jgi:hypothetical protein
MKYWDSANSVCASCPNSDCLNCYVSGVCTKCRPGRFNVTNNCLNICPENCLDCDEKGGKLNKYIDI